MGNEENYLDCMQQYMTKGGGRVSTLDSPEGLLLVIELSLSIEEVQRASHLSPPLQSHSHCSTLLTLSISPWINLPSENLPGITNEFSAFA